MTTMDEVATTLQKLWPRAKTLTRNRAEAEDLMQDTFLRAVKFIDGFQGGHLIAWLNTMMYHLFLTKRRGGAGKAGRYTYQQRMVSIETMPPGWDIPVECTPDAQWDLEQTLRAISGLPPNFRTALEMIAEGVSYQEIARQSGCSINTLKPRLSRAREALRDKLTRRRLPKNSPLIH